MPFKIVHNKLKDSWLIVLFLHPGLYLFTILKHVFFIGCFTMALSYFYFNSEYSTIRIPTITHTLIGVAMGMLLVFRTQSAYERWTTASKNFYNIQASFCLLGFKLKTILTNESEIKEFKNIIHNFADNFSNFLKEDEDEIKSEILEKKFINDLEILTINLKRSIKNDSESSVIYRIINEIIQNSFSCVRIKETPIPKSYEMHIKISIFLYILTLPFGLFYELGMWSIFMVMFVYYIIAGIEIISREIENPFEGTPNDLPLGKYVIKIKRCLD